MTGIYHLFYQDHLALAQNGVGIGPVWAHVASRDLAKWARLGVALWNDKWYDKRAVFTGSATIVDGVPFLIFAGLCDPKAQPPCTPSGATYALARPANRSDPLLRDWMKLDAVNPILNGTADDPTTAWRTGDVTSASREYRLLGNGGAAGQKTKGAAPLFGAPNITGPWHLIGDSPFPAGECPSLFPLPPLTQADTTGAKLPTHVYVRGYDRKDWYTLGTYTTNSDSRTDVGNWNQSIGVLFAERRIDRGNFYASKDFWCDKTQRRILWGWATTSPASQTLPRQVLYEPRLRQLVFRPVEELALLHTGPPLAQLAAPLTLAPNSTHTFFVGGDGAGNASDVTVTLQMPTRPTQFTVRVLGDGSGNEGSMSAHIDWVPPANSSSSEPYPVNVGIDYSPKPHNDHGATGDTLQLLPSDKTLDLRIFTDRTVVECFFQSGRVAVTAGAFHGARSRGQIMRSRSQPPTRL